MTIAAPTTTQPTILSKTYAVEVALGLVALSCAAHVVRLFAGHTFWYDEAMLLANIADGTWADLFGPLPFYDQAAPQLYLVLLKMLHTLFGLNEIVLRLPSLGAAVACLWLIATRMPGLTRLERAMAAVVLAGSITFAYLTTETKQYTFEILCSCALMVAFSSRQDLVQLSQHRYWLRFGLLAAAMVLASTFPLAAFAVGIAWMLSGVGYATLTAPHALGLHLLTRIRAGGWVFAAAGLVYIAYYLTAIRPAYAALLGNFGYTYQGFGFVREGNYLVWLTNNVDTILASHYGFLGLPLFAAALWGGWQSAERGLRYVPQIVALASIVVVLNVAGVYPILPARFSVFLLPWFAVMAGLGLATLVTLIKDKGLQTLAATGLAVVTLLPAATYILSPITHDAKQSIAYLKAHSDTPVMVTVSSQPLYDLYLKQPNAMQTDRCLASGVFAYTNRCRALKAPGDGVLQGAQTKWYLLNYAAIIGRGVPPVGFPGGDPKAFALSYKRWLVEQPPIRTDVLVLSAPHTVDDTDGGPLFNALTMRARIERVANDATHARSVRSARVDRVHRYR
jgi:hypothetical protein